MARVIKSLGQEGLDRFLGSPTWQPAKDDPVLHSLAVVAPDLVLSNLDHEKLRAEVLIPLIGNSREKSLLFLEKCGEFVGSSNPSVREAAYRILGRSGPGGHDMLIDCLEKKPEDMRLIISCWLARKTST